MMLVEIEKVDVVESYLLRFLQLQGFPSGQYKERKTLCE